MIRVTCADGVIRYDFARLFYGYWYCYNIQLNKRVEYSVENVYKIEKQVKDLTLEECRELNIIFDIIFGIGCCYDNNGDNDYDFDDYVDITQIYKEAE